MRDMLDMPGLEDPYHKMGLWLIDVLRAVPAFVRRRRPARRPGLQTLRFR